MPNDALTARTRQAVVFDLDGTLVDSLPAVLKAFAHALEPFLPEAPRMDIFAQLGGPPSRVFARLLGGAENVPAALARLDDYLANGGPVVAPFAGADRLLTELRQGAIPLGLWTGRDRGTTEALLTNCGWSEIFQVIVCGDDLPSHKPDPEGLRQILTELDCRPQDAILLGDADVDVLGGEASGVDTLLIQHGRELDPAIAARAWHIAPDVEVAYRTLRDHLGGSSTRDLVSSLS